jgi:hypothetical protein
MLLPCDAWLLSILGFFYYLLGNLSPVLRSQLKSIQLLAVAKATVIVKYGADAILDPIMNDIKVLEQVRWISLSLVYLFLIYYCTGWNIG